MLSWNGQYRTVKGQWDFKLNLYLIFFLLIEGRWKLTAETGGNKGGDNFGDIVMVMSGDDGETKPAKLTTTREKPFQIGQIDVFDVGFFFILL